MIYRNSDCVEPGETRSLSQLQLIRRAPKWKLEEAGDLSGRQMQRASTFDTVGLHYMLKILLEDA